MISELAQQEVMHVGGGCTGGDMVVSKKFDRHINVFTAIGIVVGVALIANGIVEILYGVDAMIYSLQDHQSTGKGEL